MSWIDQRPDDAMAGAFEAIGPDPVKTIDPAAFRDAMSRLGAAVHVVATDGPAGRMGFTATAVCSVSDQPATLLVCLHRRSRTAPVLSANGVFSVSTLRAEEEAVADLFAGRGDVPMAERFAAAQWLKLDTGTPVLASAVVAFDCRVLEIKAVASHNVIFGAVAAVHIGPAAAALVYHEREYKRV